MCDFNLDKGESRPRSKGFVLMFNLVSQIFLHTFLLKHLLLPFSPEQDPRGNSYSHCVLWLRLQKTKVKVDNGKTKMNKKNKTKLKSNDKVISG